MMPDALFGVVFFVALLFVGYLLYQRTLRRTPPELRSPRSSQPQPRRRVVAKRPGEATWIQDRTVVEIVRAEIPVEMVYVGRGLPALSDARSVEPALIDPTLKVNWRRPDRWGAGLSYWLSYRNIKPESRAAYLEWLAGGRRDPDAHIGYVLLFFYGLERRVLHEARSSTAARAEIPRLVEEVQQLIEVYGYDESFRTFASSFILSATMVFVPERRFYEPGPWLGGPIGVLTFETTAALAQLVADGRPVPPDWALAWLLGHPDTKLRKPAARCEEEFRELFQIRYTERFGPGMKLKEPKRKLGFTYLPASWTFGGEVELPLGDLSDVTALKAPIRKLRAIAEACTDELAPLSRYLARNPEGADSLMALGLLPAELLASRSSDELRELRRRLERAAAGHRSGDRESQPALMSGREIIERWDCRRDDRMTKVEATAFAGLAEKLGFGIEPDVRYGGPSISSKNSVAVFKLPDARAEAPSDAYSKATLILQLGAAVAVAGDDLTSAEEQKLEEHLETALHLSRNERARLRAHLRWLLETQPGLRGVKKRLEGVDERTKEAVGKFSVIMAGADGRLDPAEVKTLGKIYELLDLDPQQVFSDIHELGDADLSAAPVPSEPAAEPVTLRAAEPPEPGYAVPRPPAEPQEPRPEGFALDMSRLRARIAETEKVSALLSEIFDEDDEGAEAEDAGPGVETEAPEEAGGSGPPEDPGGGEPVIEGLDRAHSALLLALAERDSWTRAEVEALAARFDLLPDGAMDRINEAALERCDEPVLEGDDPIEVIQEPLEEML